MGNNKGVKRLNMYYSMERLVSEDEAVIEVLEFLRSIGRLESDINIKFNGEFDKLVELWQLCFYDEEVNNKYVYFISLDGGLYREVNREGKFKSVSFNDLIDKGEYYTMSRDGANGDYGSKKKKSHVKLSEDDVRGIRRMYEGGRTMARLSEIYGVHRTTISKIINNHIWKDVV